MHEIETKKIFRIYKLFGLVYLALSTSFVSLPIWNNGYATPRMCL